VTMLVALYALLLSAYAGTAIEYSEPLCGGTGAALSVADFEDRAFASSWRQGVHHGDQNQTRQRLR
jgi:hypothetical protein